MKLTDSLTGGMMPIDGICYCDYDKHAADRLKALIKKYVAKGCTKQKAEHLAWKKMHR